MAVIEVNGWLLEEEQAALRRWCFDQEVLEMGCFEGLSTINIATTARGLITVDSFDARGTSEAGERDTEEAFWNNINAKHGEICPVRVHKGLFADVLPAMDRDFDRIFIDGSHDYESVKQDIELATPLLRPGGKLIMHDYCLENPGVVQAVDELIEAGAVPVAQAASLIMLDLDYKPPDTKPIKVAIAMPNRDGWVHYGSAKSILHAPITSIAQEVEVMVAGYSVLTLTFNELFSKALNLRDKEGFTHFAMLHNDVVPEDGWVEILLKEMFDQGLDMLSAVVPLKNERGLTSTATDTPGYPWGVRRLTMKEVMELPETFTAKDIKHRLPDACLMLNSGCWIMKLNEPWVQGLHFRQQDRIEYSKMHQEWIPLSISEDWDFSRQMHARGCRLGATRKVRLYHQVPCWNNHEAWGTWENDQDFLTAQREIAEYKARIAADG